MIFKCGMSWSDRRLRREDRKAAYLKQWHPFFALWPRRIDERCVWLHMIRRKGIRIHGHYCGVVWDWSYRLSMNDEMFYPQD